MSEYDTLLEVRYGLVTDDPYDCIHAQYGVSEIKQLRELIHNTEIVIALDQATRKTGMCIMRFEDRKVLAVLDLINTGFPSKQQYFMSIYSFLVANLSGENIRYFFYEIPIEHSNNTRTLAILESMRSFIADFTKRMPEVLNSNILEIYSNSWRHHFLVDKAYQGRRKTRSDLKEAARDESIVRVPELQQYFMQSSEPPDSCDAVGIAYGALEEIYGGKTNDLRQPNTTMPKKNIKFEIRIVPATSDEIVLYLERIFPVQLKSNQIEVLRFNTAMSVNDNCQRYCGTSKTALGVIMVTDRKVAQELKWESGQELKPGQNYYIVCRRE